jgi:hypothetical protein
MMHELVARIEGCVRLLGLSELERKTSAKVILRAALDDVSRLECELFYLQHNVPEAILATPAPDDDERDEREEGGA